MSALCDFSYEENEEGDTCEAWDERRVRARKAHTCTECCEKIKPGERYGRASGLLYGEGWETWKRCPACMILVELAATLVKECPLWGRLDEFIEDHRGYDLPADFPSPHEHRKRWEAA